MKIKHIITIFLMGLTTGIIIGPLTDKILGQTIKSPAPNVFALKNSMPSGNDVLGVGSKNSNNLVIKKASSTQNIPKVNFGDLINKDLELEEEKEEKIKQTTYSGAINIAIFGDSMTDVMGSNLPFLEEELKKYYPEAKLKLLNYGVGAQNIEQGFARLAESYHYKDRNYPSLLKLNPEIIIIQPFDYNPLARQDNELDYHWSFLADIVSTIKSKTKAKIIILATIAPNHSKFGQGSEGIGLSSDLAWQKAKIISTYLENTTRFATSAQLPLVDVYNETLLESGLGDLGYLDPKHYIHQNEKGNKLIAKRLAEKIVSLDLFKD